MSTPVECQRLHAMFAKLWNRTSDARSQLHTRSDRGEHGHSAKQHVPTTPTHGPETVQHDRLSHGMADFGMVKGTYMEQGLKPKSFFNSDFVN